jgi:hypothetical protein
LLSLKSFVIEKRLVAMQKLFIKKRRRKKERIGKNGQVSKISKTMGTQMLA